MDELMRVELQRLWHVAYYPHEITLTGATWIPDRQHIMVTPQSHKVQIGAFEELQMSILNPNPYVIELVECWIEGPLAQLLVAPIIAPRGIPGGTSAEIRMPICMPETASSGDKYEGRLIVQTRRQGHFHSRQFHFIVSCVAVETNFPFDCSPHQLDFGELPIHQQYKFTIAIQQQYYLQLACSAHDWTPLPMDELPDGGGYVAWIDIPDGEHYYTFLIDGYPIVSNDVHQRIVEGRGIAGVLILSRFTRYLELISQATKRIEVHARASHPWISISPKKIRLSKRSQRGQIAVSLNRELLSFGVNTGWITLTCDGMDEALDVPVRVAYVQVEGPALSTVKMPDTVSSEKLFKGTQKEYNIAIANVGKGALTGQVEDTNEITGDSFELVTYSPAQPASQEISLIINTECIQGHGRKQIQAFITTNSYLASQRRVPLDFEFELVDLIVAPECIDFGDVFLGDSEEKSVEIKRSDDERIELDWELSTRDKHRKQSLKIQRTEDGLKIVFDPYEKLDQLDCDLLVTDTRTKLKKTIHLTGKPIIASATIDISLERKHKTSPPKLIVKVRNTSSSSILKIRNLSFRGEPAVEFPPLGEFLLEPGEDRTLEGRLCVSRLKAFVGDVRVYGQLRLDANVPRKQRTYDVDMTA